MSWSTTRGCAPTACRPACAITTPLRLAEAAESVPQHRHPSAFLRALGNRFAQHQFVVSVFERRERAARLEISRIEIPVEIPEQLHESVGITFRVPPRISGKPTRRRA